MTKDELRAEMRRRARTADPAALAAASGEIVCAIENLAAWRAARLVCAFVPLRTEPQIHPLWQRESGPAFCFPRISGAALSLLRIEGQALPASADWKLDAPEFSSCPRVDPAEVDVVLVPGLAFTRDGRRLGRGGGWYDRLLVQCPPRTLSIGVCFAWQIVAALPMDAHDRRVARLVSAPEQR